MMAIADTGFLVGFLSETDRHNDWAIQAARGITTPMLTCEAVLAETAFHLRSAAPVLELINRGALEVAFHVQAELTHLVDLAGRFADRRPDFADLCLIRMSELHPRHVVITIDENDFRVYRRTRRDSIPLLCPPKQQ